MYSFKAVAIVSGLLLFPVVAPLKLNITAIGASHGRSTLECWQLDDPFSPSSEPGSAAGPYTAQLGDLSNITYTFIPPNYDQGFHTAPWPQWVVFTTGLAHITLPDDNSTGAYIFGGEFGVIFAADTPDVSLKGHRSQYPGDMMSIGLQIPTKDGEIPVHDILHSGPCKLKESYGLRELALNVSLS
ncbi:hypothetical protein F4677DRAFT_418518 [Hypoxylon crocopeplum]|nr:hypothetical protein F4677DRAFT_418518 [Hypoxylon crocopeplum]